MTNKKALLILDMNNIYVYDAPLIPIETREALIANIRKSIKLARKKNVPVIYIDSAFRLTDPIFQLINYRDQATEGNPRNKVIEELKPEKSDYVLTKRGYDGFWESQLSNTLKKLGIKELYITGCQTDCCVRETVVTASHIGYDVYVLRDCCQTNREFGQIAALRFLTNCTKGIIDSVDLRKYF